MSSMLDETVKHLYNLTSSVFVWISVKIIIISLSLSLSLPLPLSPCVSVCACMYLWVCVRACVSVCLRVCVFCFCFRYISGIITIIIITTKYLILLFINDGTLKLFYSIVMISLTFWEFYLEVSHRAYNPNIYIYIYIYSTYQYYLIHAYTRPI